MINRKNLYGYHIENGELAIVPQEAETVQRITTLYIAGGSYQSIAETLNDDGTPFSTEAPLWNKHKVKRIPATPDRRDIPLSLTLRHSTLSRE